MVDMKISQSDQIDLISLATEVKPGVMNGLINIILTEINEVIDPTFIDPETKYLGRIDRFAHDNLGPHEIGFLDMCLSDLEMFAVSSERADGMVLLRKGDEMIILTEYNAEVIQEQEMSDMMYALQQRISEYLQETSSGSSQGMYR